MNEESIEIESNSEEDAIQRACDALNARRENLGHEIIEQKKRRGIMGLMGGAKIRIRAWRRDSRGEVQSPVIDASKQLLGEMVTPIAEGVEITAREQSDSITLDITCDDGGLVIGKNGQTLDAIQYLLRKAMARVHPENEKQIVVNAEGYRERRRDNLISMARRVAGKVRKSKRRETLRPMNSYERRIIHLTLQDEQGVTSRSQGEGHNRCIVVAPEGGRGGGRGKREARASR